MFLGTQSPILPITFHLFSCFLTLIAPNSVSVRFLVLFLRYLGKVRFSREYLLPLWMMTIFYFVRMEIQASITLLPRTSVSPNEGTEPLFPLLTNESLEIHWGRPAMVTLHRLSDASRSRSC